MTVPRTSTLSARVIAGTHGEFELDGIRRSKFERLWRDGFLAGLFRGDCIVSRFQITECDHTLIVRFAGGNRALLA